MYKEIPVKFSTSYLQSSVLNPNQDIIRVQFACPTCAYKAFPPSLKFTSKLQRHAFWVTGSCLKLALVWCSTWCAQDGSLAYYLPQHQFDKHFRNINELIH